MTFVQEHIIMNYTAEETRAALDNNEPTAYYPRYDALTSQLKIAETLSGWIKPFAGVMKRL